MLPDPLVDRLGRGIPIPIPLPLDAFGVSISARSAPRFSPASPLSTNKALNPVILSNFRIFVSVFQIKTAHLSEHTENL